MAMFVQEILEEIDSTLEQLIGNLEALRGIKKSQITESEIVALNNTQESLLHHFLYMNLVLECRNKRLRCNRKQNMPDKIKVKVKKFESLDREISHVIPVSSGVASLALRRRMKQYWRKSALPIG